MLDASAQQSLIASLDIDDDGPDAWLRLFYESAIAKYEDAQQSRRRFDRLESVYGLAGNGDVLANKAEVLYLQNDTRASLEITSVVRSREPHEFRCVPVHICALVELGWSMHGWAPNAKTAKRFARSTARRLQAQSCVSRSAVLNFGPAVLPTLRVCETSL